MPRPKIIKTIKEIDLIQEELNAVRDTSNDKLNLAIDKIKASIRSAMNENKAVREYNLAIQDLRDECSSVNENKDIITKGPQGELRDMNVENNKKFRRKFNELTDEYNKIEIEFDGYIAQEGNPGYERCAKVKLYSRDVLKGILFEKGAEDDDEPLVAVKSNGISLSQHVEESDS